MGPNHPSIIALGLFLAASGASAQFFLPEPDRLRVPDAASVSLTRDLNGDGRIDRVVSFEGAGAFSRGYQVAFGSDAGGYVLGYRVPALDVNFSGCGFDLDNDGLLECIRGIPRAGVESFEFHADGSFAPPNVAFFPEQFFNSAFFRVDSNDTTDLVLWKQETDPQTFDTTFTAFFVATQPSGFFGFPTQILSTADPRSGLRVIDETGDGYPDFLWFNDEHELVRVPSQGPAAWGAPETVTESDERPYQRLGIQLAQDLDGDQATDLVVTRSVISTDFQSEMDMIEFWPSNSNGGFGEPVVLFERVTERDVPFPWIRSWSLDVEGETVLVMSALDNLPETWQSRTRLFRFQSDGSYTIRELPSSVGSLYSWLRDDDGNVSSIIGYVETDGGSRHAYRMLSPVDSEIVVDLGETDRSGLGIGDGDGDGLLDLSFKDGPTFQFVPNIGTADQPTFDASATDRPIEVVTSLGSWPTPGPVGSRVLLGGITDEGQHAFVVAEQDPPRLRAISTTPVARPVTDVEVIDVVGDTTRLAVIQRDNGQSTVSIFAGSPEVGFTLQGEYDAGSANIRRVAPGDFDGDGSTDLAVLNRSNVADPLFRVAWGAPGGTFSPWQNVDTPDANATAFARGADLDGDGSDELVIQSDRGADYTVWSCSAFRGFTLQQTQEFNGMLEDEFELIDISRDGLLDLVAATRAKLVITLGVPGGLFSTPIEITLSDQIRSLATADLEGDNTHEIIVTLQNDNRIRVLDAEGSELWTSAFTTIPPADKLIASDLDADGRMDLIVADNSGDFGVHFGSPEPCPADLTGDGVVNFFDLGAFLTGFNTQDPIADLAAPFGVFNFFDLGAFLEAFNAGCP